MSWEEEILGKLSLRDQYEQKDSEFIGALTELRNRLILSETIKQDNNKNNEQSISKLMSENLQLKQENSSLILNVNQLGHSNDSYQLKLKELELINSKQNKSLESLKNKINDMKQELQEKNKTIEIINDEILSGLIQNNVLQRKIEELSKENDGLIQRWIEKVKKDAETMNEVNEMLAKEKQ